MHFSGLILIATHRRVVFEYLILKNSSPMFTDLIIMSKIRNQNIAQPGNNQGYQSAFWQGYGLTDRRTGVRFPLRAEIFLFVTASGLSLRHTRSPTPHVIAPFP